MGQREPIKMVIQLCLVFPARFHLVLLTPHPPPSVLNRPSGKMWKNRGQLKPRLYLSPLLFARNSCDSSTYAKQVSGRIPDSRVFTLVVISIGWRATITGNTVVADYANAATRRLPKSRFRVVSRSLSLPSRFFREPCLGKHSNFS